MRLLHTSDWHLGRSLHRADRHDAQAAFIDHLVDTVRSESIDAVLIAGDVYDRALPPVESVELCNEALFRLRDAGARVVLISGNHDSARRLGINDRLVAASGVHLRTRVSAVADPVLLEDSHGPVAVYAIPYLEPAAVAGELPGAPIETRSHEAVLRRAADLARTDLAGRRVRSIAMAHGWVAGGLASDSERDISVGGVGSVPASVFDGFDYVALGHLHGRAALAPHLRYSGSPLAFSFSEAAHVKGSWLLEIGAGGLGAVEFVEAPVPRRLSTARGTLEELLTSAAHEGISADFLSVTLTDPARPEAAMDKLRARFPHVLVLEWVPEAGVVDERGYRTRLRGRSDAEIARDFVAHARGTEASAAESALLDEAFAAVARRDSEDATPSADAA
ncbi:MAG: exonuclease SbcCD subunit D [Sporichthyaceae bacterium]